MGSLILACCSIFIWVTVINFAGYCLRFLSQWLLSGYYFSVSADVAISTPVTA